MSDGQYDNEKRGVLFRNNPAAGGTMHPQAPAYKGQATVEGVEYWLSSWLETSKSGQKYMSLKFEKKEPRPDSVYSQNAQANIAVAQVSPKQAAPAAEDDFPF